MIVATPLRVAGERSGPSTERRSDVERLGTSPIVNVHLVLDRKVTDLAARRLRRLAGPVRLRPDRLERGRRSGQCLAISLSAADDYIGRGSSELVSIFFEALGELLPGRAREARLVDALVTRERAATFRAVPGTGRSARRRDRGARPVPGRRLVRHRLAGDDGGRGAQRPAGRLPGAGSRTRPPEPRAPRAGRGRDVTVISSPARRRARSGGRRVP